jgi:hypothetical protein
MNDYTANGFANRREYLESLAEDFGIDRETVFMMASMLGASEDFDGLVTALEDHAEDFY